MNTQTVNATANIIVVSGLPRSGTSLMMNMLEVGGIPPLTDQLRTADSSNPNGYYEFERVKQLPKGDIAWLEHASGKAIKVISSLLTHLPTNHQYKIIFMRRRMEEILQSQQRMLATRQETSAQSVSTDADDATLADLFQKHVGQVQAWLAQQPTMEVLEVDYNQLLAEPEKILYQLEEFLAWDLDLQQMRRVIDPALYRNRISMEKGAFHTKINTTRRL